MRKIYTIGLLAIHIIAHTELNQFLNVPRLLNHYFQHKEKDPELGFFAFLEEHYGSNDGNQADDNTHRKLPFRHLQQNHAGFVVAKLEMADHEINQIPQTKLSISTYMPLGNPSEHVHLFLQPPKQA